MARKRKNIAKGISQELSRRARSEVSSRRDLAKSRVRTSIERFIPMQFRWILPYLESFKPGRYEEEAEGEILTEPGAIAPESRTLPKPLEPLYPQYRCSSGNPLSCDRLQQIEQIQSGDKYCLECGFPATLPYKAEIRGKKGRYRVESLLNDRGLGRLYRGTLLANNQPIVIKEYLLPSRYFSETEIQQRKQTFELVAGVNLADGRTQDFRVVHPWDAIADFNEERCYLVTQGNIDLYPTLNNYLALYGAMSATQVRHVLNQVLQSLEFLHTQKLRLPSGIVQPGLAHGNLSLNSLLIAKNLKSIYSNGSTQPHLLDTEFLIYICDLVLWERLFDAPTSEILYPTPAQDLVALGYVAFYLLAGSRVNSTSGQLLNPKVDRQWPAVDFALKGFILRLMGIGIPFISAEEARQELLKLPQDLVAFEADLQPLPEEEEPSQTPRLLLLLLISLGLLCFGGLLWLLLSRNQQVTDRDFIPCCIDRVAAVPTGSFTYTAEPEGSGRYIFKQENLIDKNQTLEAELETRQSDLALTFNPAISGEDAIAQVRNEQADFAIASLVNEVTPDLDYKEVAYDGVVVFVNFSYSLREKSLPNALNGQISFEDLRNLYTGKITNWRQLGGGDLPVKLYIPTNSEAVRIFEQRVLKDETSIQLFRKLQEGQNSPASFIRNTVITPLSTFPLLRRVIQDFEDEEIGAIGFDTFSKVFGQCSVYPLALKIDRENPVQALAQSNGIPVSPATDLCNDKGSYSPNFQAFRENSYPLAYPLAIVYPRDNSRPAIGLKVADMLRTEEGQQLLNKTGVVPLYPLDRR